jgi:hypothetical protein
MRRQKERDRLPVTRQRRKRRVGFIAWFRKAGERGYIGMKAPGQAVTLSKIGATGCERFPDRIVEWMHELNFTKRATTNPSDFRGKLFFHAAKLARAKVQSTAQFGGGK